MCCWRKNKLVINFICDQEDAAFFAKVRNGLYFISTPVAAGLTSSECHNAEMTEERVGAGQFECEPVTGDAAKWFSLIAFAQTPIHINDIVFDNDNEDPVAMAAAELPAGVPIAWYLLMTAGPGFFLWWRYQRVRL